MHLSYADEKDDIDLCEYVSKLAKAKGFDFSPEFIMEDGLFDNYDDDFAVLYYLAVQAAELRSRLKLYEDKLENGTLIELPCKEGENLYYISNKNTIGCFLDVSYETILMCINDYHNGEIKFMATTREKAESKLKEINHGKN